jgi:hypothetical protein
MRIEEMSRAELGLLVRCGGGPLVSAGAHVSPLQESRIMTAHQILDFYTRPAAVTSGV